MISTQSQNTEVSPAGLLIVNKPTGVTSRAVVNQVARLLPRSKVGHSGTLDPLATGILVVCVGAATRLAEFVQAMPKSYQTTIRLGARSDTLDADGRIEQVECPCEPSIDLIGAAIAPLVGTITQQPPQYSALKINGQRAYDLARFPPWRRGRFGSIASSSFDLHGRYWSSRSTVAPAHTSDRSRATLAMRLVAVATWKR